MSYLSAGKILKVNLTDRTITTEPTARYEGKFIGGKSIAAKLLYDEVVPGTDALAPGNALVFAAGALSGTPCPGSGRTYVTAKSPLSGYLGSSNVSGFWGPELKFAGYDQLVVKGKADKPVYIAIDNDRVEIRDADGIWGKNVTDAQTAIRKELNDQDTQLLCIGPAGEKLIRYAIVAHGIMSAAARTGLGAVMGSKNLKAIAVRGRGDLKLADPKKFLELCKVDRDAIMAQPFAVDMAEIGVTKAQDAFNADGQQGIFNYQKGNSPGNAAQEAFAKQYSKKSMACFSCPMGCRQYYTLPGLPAEGMKCALYSPLYTANVFDPMLNYEAASLCQEGGVDVVYISGVIGWLMELSQRGIITEKDTDGIVLQWGEAQGAIQIIKKIIAREGIGDVLAESHMAFAKKVGKGAEDYFIASKGLPINYIDLRGTKGNALAGAISTKGDFMSIAPLLDMMEPVIEMYQGEEREGMQAWLDDFATQVTGTPKAGAPREYEGKAASVKYYEDVVNLADTMGVCRWQGDQAMMPMTIDALAELYSAGKGMAMTGEGLLEAAQRGHAVERAFAAREGLTRDDDTLPKRFMQEPLPEGRYKGEMVDTAKLEEMKTEYYTLRGWDPATGAPSQETFEKLGLGDMAESLKKETKEGKTKGKNVK
jgi:aldehyde:ferredoxin oxidoreductase